MSQIISLSQGGVFPPGTVVQTLTGNTGGPVGPDGTNNINIVGAGGVDVAGNAGTNTLTITASGSIATTYDADTGSATPAANILQIFGGANIATTGAGNTITIDLNGTTNHAVQIGNLGGSLSSLPIGTNGQVLLGATGGDPSWHSPTAGTGLTITSNASTLEYAAAASLATQYDTDSGSAVPAANILQILGAHGINTAGATNVVTVAIDNTITLGDLAVVGPAADSLTLTTGDMSLSAGNINLTATAASGDSGVVNVNSNRFIHSYGTGNTFVGEAAGNFTLTTANAVFNTGIGYHCLQSLTDGTTNTAVGISALGLANTGSQNSAFGFQPLASLTTGTGNCAFGTVSLNTLLGGDDNICYGDGTLSGMTGGSRNIALGNGTGQAYNANQSDNILIGGSLLGDVADANTLRIGISGSGNYQQNRCFVAGIDGVNVGSTAKVVTMGTAGTVDQLGTTVITAGTGITVTPGANTITISSAGAGFSWNDVTGGSATMAAENGYIANSASLTTLTMPTLNNLGDTIKVVGKGSGGWTIVYGALQQIIMGSSSATITTGSLSSTNAHDCVELVCTSASLTAPIFTVVSSIGNITIV